MQQINFTVTLKQAWKDIPTSDRLPLMQDEIRLKEWIAQIFVSHGLAKSIGDAFGSDDFKQVYKQFIGV